MWSSIENLKENLNKIALDVHEDDEYEDDLLRYGTANGVGDLPDSDRRNSSGFRSSRSVWRYPISNGIESPDHHEIERYKAEIKKLQESEADIKALSLNYAALLREKEDQISRLNKENGSLKQNQSPKRLQKSVSLSKSRNHMSNGKGTDSHIKEKDLADMVEERTKSLAAVQAKELAKEREKLRDVQLSLQEEQKRNDSFKEEIESLRLDKNKTSLEISKVPSELDARLLEIKQLQMKLNGEGSHAVGTAVEHLKEANKALEKENSELKLKRTELEAALEESRRPTSSKVFPDATESLTRHPSSLEKEKPENFPVKEEMEKSLQKLETDLKETRRERDKARQELKRLKQHLLEKDADERLEFSNKEKEEVTSKLVHAEKVAAEWKNRVSKVEEDNAKVGRVLEQSMTRLNRMSVDSDYLVDRRIVIKLLVTYFQKNHSKEVLELMVRMLGFSEEDKERIGVAQQGGGKGVVRGVLGFPGRFVGGTLGGKSVDSHASNQSFADLWVDFLLKDAEERERREAEEAAAAKAKAKAKQDLEKTREDAGLSNSEFSAVPLRSSESHQRLSRLLA